MAQVVRIWDLPTRWFHWMLALSVCCSFATAWLGGDVMTWHFRCGYFVCALILFRLVWGFAGGYWSRFAHFPLKPIAIWRYLRGFALPAWSVGHSPIGAVAILLMLLCISLQIGSGLITDNDNAWTGPFTHLFSNTWVALATYYHTTWGKVILLGLLGTHLGAVVFYRFFKGLHLVRAMFTGDKFLDEPFPASQDSWPLRILAAAIFVLLLWAIFRYLP
jgi:cytochrome b